MAEHRPTTSAARHHVDSNPLVHGGLRLTRADFDALVLELDRLRSKHRAELERRLRDARDFGSPADNDDVMTVLEEAAVDESRISRVEDLVRSAVVVEDASAFDGGAGLGCLVTVSTDAGATAEYRLVGRRGPEAGPDDVSLGAPVGKALVGARAGDQVSVTLPNGRQRTLRVVAVAPPLSDAQALLFDRKAA